MFRVVSFYCVLCLAAQAVAAEKLSYRQIAEQVSPSVVHIQITQKRTVNDRRRGTVMQVEESGSGFVAEIAGQKVVLTSSHVVSDVNEKNIQILTSNRSVLSVDKIIANEETDIAVMIPVSETASALAELKPVVFGSSDALAAGDAILIFGSPFGLEHSLSSGIISAVGRRNIPGTGITVPRVHFFQVDAAVNPGSSGGPMFNTSGEAVGMSTAIATQGGGNEGVAFVIPIKTVRRIAEQLVKTGSAVKPYIGCGFDSNFTFEDHRRLGIDRLIGAKIKTLDSAGPAAKADWKVGDVVLKFNGTEVEDEVHLALLVSEAEIGKPITVQVQRGTSTLNAEITPAKQLSR